MLRHQGWKKNSVGCHEICEKIIFGELSGVFLYNLSKICVQVSQTDQNTQPRRQDAWRKAREDTQRLDYFLITFLCNATEHVAESGGIRQTTFKRENSRDSR